MCWDTFLSASHHHHSGGNPNVAGVTSPFRGTVLSITSLISKLRALADLLESEAASTDERYDELCAPTSTPSDGAPRRQAGTYSDPTGAAVVALTTDVVSSGAAGDPADQIVERRRWHRERVRWQQSCRDLVAIAVNTPATGRLALRTPVAAARWLANVYEHQGCDQMTAGRVERLIAEIERCIWNAATPIDEDDDEPVDPPAPVEYCIACLAEVPPGARRHGMCEADRKMYERALRKGRVIRDVQTFAHEIQRRIAAGDLKRPGSPIEVRIGQQHLSVPALPEP